MILLGIALLGLLPAADPQSKPVAVAEFGAFPAGAVVFGRVARPGRGIEDTHNLLRDSGHFGLARGIEDLFYRDRTEDGGTTQSLGDALGSLLDPTISPLVSSYLSSLEDWGRGIRPEATRRAMHALEKGEFAIYPGGKSLQLLRGDTETWRAVVQEKGPVRKVTGEGKGEIFEIDAGRRGRFVAMLPDGAVLRSQDLPLLQRALALGRGDSRELSIRSTPLSKEAALGSREEELILCLIDGPAFLRDLAENATISDTLLPWIREAFRGVKGIRYALEPMQIHLEILAESGAPLFALLGEGAISSLASNGPLDKPLARVGLHLDLAKILDALASGGSAEDEEENPFGPKAMAAMLSNFELGRAKLWVNESDRATLCVPAKDAARWSAAWALGKGFAAFVPGLRAEPRTLDDGEVISWKRPGEQGKEIFAIARTEKWLFVSAAADDAVALMSRLRSENNYLDASRFGGAVFRTQGKDFLADLSPVVAAWTGTLWAQCLFIPGARPTTSLRFDLGVRAEAWKRVAQLWNAVKENRPGWHGKLEAALFGEYEPPQSIGEFTMRWTKKKDRIVAASSDRIRLEWNFDFIRPLLSLGAREKEDAEAFQAAVESGLRQKPAIPENLVERATIEASLDLEPFYEEVVKNPALFRGFVRIATSSWDWPWFSLRSKQHIAVSPSANGIRIDGETNSDPGLGSLLSTFFDRYQPSIFEERAMARAVAIEEAQRIFQSSKAHDLNGNGTGEFASLPTLFQPGKSPVPLTRAFSSTAAYASEFVEEGYRYRLLLPKAREEQEKRWCLFVFPETVDLDHHIVFYIDERGFLMAGWQVMNEQMEFEGKDLFVLLNLPVGPGKPAQFQHFCLKSETPPEHRQIYDYFLPYLPLYGGRLQQGD